MPIRNASSRSRRRFLKLVPAAVGAGLAVPRSLASQTEPQTPIAKDTLECAERVAGVTFTDAEHELMRQSVATNHDHFEALRRVPIGYDVEAFAFKPYQRPPTSSGRADRGDARVHATPNARLRIDRPRAAGRPSDETLAFMPVTALAPLLEARVVSSIELTELYLARLKQFGDAKPYEDQVPSIDATAVERLRDAGAVLVAKLSTGELAYGDVWFRGRTRNPWSVERGSSGSSAGPAAATAAGLVGFAVGTETGGSIISPAHTCGVVGLRPTYGRISRYGVMTLRWTMDKVGPLARSVEDCVVVLNALYGPDGRDDTVADVPLAWDRDRPLGSLRIGVVDQFSDAEAAGDEEERRRWPAQQHVLVRALDLLRRAGAELRPLKLPDFPARAMYAALNAEAGAAFDDMIRAGKVNDLAGKGATDRANQLRISRLIPAVEYIRAQRARTLLGRQMEDVMAGCDAFLAPSTSASVTTTNLTGHPAVTLNAGFAEGLPVGLMVTGRLYDEGTMLRVALAYEHARGALNDRPPLPVTTAGGAERTGARNRT